MLNCDIQTPKEYCMYPYTKAVTREEEGGQPILKGFTELPSLNTQGLLKAFHFIWLFGLVSELPTNVRATNGQGLSDTYFIGLVTQQAPNEQKWNPWLFKFPFTNTLIQWKDPRAKKMSHVTTLTGISKWRERVIFSLHFSIFSRLSKDEYITALKHFYSIRGLEEREIRLDCNLTKYLVPR